MIETILKLRDAFYLFVIAILFFATLHEHDLEKLAQANNAILQNQIAEQNIAILEWKAHGEDLERKLRLTEQEASARARESQKRVNTILSAKIPADCQAAIRWGIAHR